MWNGVLYYMLTVIEQLLGVETTTFFVLQTYMYEGRQTVPSREVYWLVIVSTEKLRNYLISIAMSL